MKNAERFITPELKAFEDKALSAGERCAGAREAPLRRLARRPRRRSSSRSRRVARALATLDALAALAECAQALRLVPAAVRARAVHRDRARPPSGGRGPARGARPALHANDCRLDAKRRMLVITGPNMGGKSTFMRQVALICLLASIGSFVPASACRLGPLDAIHTRIGAADDLANAQSTFMVEMTEAAAIVHTRDRALAGADGRDRPRHLDLRRPGAGRRHRPPPARPQPLVHAVRDPLLRAHRLPGEARAGAQRPCRRGRERRRHRLPARDRARAGEPQLRRAGGAPRRHAGGACCARHGRRWRAWRRSASPAQPQIDLFAAAPAPVAAARRPWRNRRSRRRWRALDPDMLTPREALDALYRLKAHCRTRTPHDLLRSASSSTPASSSSPTRAPTPGVDQISTFRKMMIYERPGDRFMVLLSAGNLSISQQVREILQIEQLENGDERADHDLERQEHVRCRARARRRGAPRLRAGRRGAARRPASTSTPR